MSRCPLYSVVDDHDEGDDYVPTSSWITIVIVVVLKMKDSTHKSHSFVFKNTIDICSHGTDINFTMPAGNTDN